ncbi:hypothetical protein [Herbaspirillum sp. C7C8]|uniref:hypothetical protein n=1 Tax=Herbaspirillum sp. C7C8 TaxID=2736665 RepID=UPI001F528EAA|nr:hypothetical protein [Herbaspirillum sp. C7C8]MCI1004977.1 hypothetical protein [Herbaspirillum sp. C7C8]
MKLLRTFLIMILAIAIPLEGLAAVRMVDFVRSVIPATEMTVSGTSSDEICVMSMSDESRSKKTTAPCKMGDACKICQVFPSTTPSAEINLHALPLVATVSLLPESFLPSRDPSGLWRPPRSL